MRVRSSSGGRSPAKVSKGWVDGGDQGIGVVAAGLEGLSSRSRPKSSPRSLAVSVMPSV